MTKLNYQSRSNAIAELTGTQSTSKTYYPLTRQQKIDMGKIWQITPDVNPDHILFEGTESQCRKEIARKFKREYRQWNIRLGKVIWEAENKPTT